MPIALPAVYAEATGLIAGREAVLGTAPVAGLQTIQPNQDGITDFYQKIKTVAPSPLSKLRQMEAPQVVDSDSQPALQHDITKDFLDLFLDGIMLSRPKHGGGTGLSYFNPTARTTTDYTVPVLGALPVGSLVRARGFKNAANNGVFQVGASSTATAIKVAGGVAETVSDYVALLEFAGFRGAAGDIGLDVNGNLTSTVVDFTTIGLVPNMVIWVGGTIAGGHDFANAAYRGFARVVSVTARLVTLAIRQWTVGAADTGAGKTIDLYFTRWSRNVPFGDADFLLQSYHFELAYFLLSGGTADEYAYAAGNLVSSFEINAPAQNLVTSAISFLGTTITNPSTTRKTGFSTAAGPLCTERLNTVTREPYRRIMLKADESIVADDIETWKLTYSNNVTAQKQQGILGNARPIVGKVMSTLDVTAAMTQDNMIAACTNNTTLMAGFGFQSSDGGCFFDIQSLKCTESTTKFPSNSFVELSLKLEAFRDQVTNITAGVSVFAFLPDA